MQLGARRADADDVRAFQRRLARDLSLVDERAVAAQVAELELTVTQHDFTMLARHAAASRQHDGAPLRVGFAADHEPLGTDAISEAAIDDVRRRLGAREHGAGLGCARLVDRPFVARRFTPRHTLQQFHVALRSSDRRRAQHAARSVPGWETLDLRVVEARELADKPRQRRNTIRQLYDEPLARVAVLGNQLNDRSIQALRHAEDRIALDRDLELFAAMLQRQLHALFALQ